MPTELPIPPCAYCGAPLRHLHSEDGYMWVVFLGGEGNPSQVVRSWKRPPGNAWADGFQCSRKCV